MASIHNVPAYALLTFHHARLQSAVARSADGFRSPDSMPDAVNIPGLRSKPVAT